VAVNALDERRRETVDGETRPPPPSAPRWPRTRPPRRRSGTRTAPRSGRPRAPGARLDLAFQPGLWAAGVDIVGISSLVTFLENTSPYRRAYREREYGSLAADREFLHEVSPLTRIDQLRAPLFIIHRANDPRVALSEAEQIHAAPHRPRPGVRAARLRQ
jgi:hypothetical protein